MKSFISNVAAGIVSAAILAILTNLYSEIGPIFDTIEWQLLVIPTLLLLLLGLCLGWLIRGAATWINTHSLLHNDQEDSSEENNQRVIMEMGIDDKALLKVLATQGEAYIETRDWEDIFSFKENYYRQFMDFESIEGGRTRLIPNASLSAFYSSNSHLFDCVSEETIVQRAIYDPDKRRCSSTHYSNRMSWWWYTDDLAIRNKQRETLEKEIEFGKHFIGGNRVV